MDDDERAVLRARIYAEAGIKFRVVAASDYVRGPFTHVYVIPEKYPHPPRWIPMDENEKKAKREEFFAIVERVGDSGPGPLVVSGPRPDARIQEYQSARMACELARNLLQQHDFTKLLSDVSLADSVGPMVDPTLWIKKSKAMEEDAEVFRAAVRFLGTWPEKSNG